MNGFRVWWCLIDSISLGDSPIRGCFILNGFFQTLELNRVDTVNNMLEITTEL